MVLPLLVFTAFTNTLKLKDDDDDDLYGHLIAKVHVAANNIVGDGLEGHEDPDVYTDSEEVRKVASIATSNPCFTITPEILSQHWNIGIPKASNTLRVTTQLGI